MRAVGKSSVAQLRCVTCSLREPEAFCLRLVAFFQDGLIRALRATACSYGLVRSLAPGDIRIGSLKTLPLIVLSQASVAG